MSLHVIGLGALPVTNRVLTEGEKSDLEMNLMVAELQMKSLQTWLGGS